MITKEDILTFLKKQNLCVLATANLTGKTEAAVMAYAVSNDFCFWLFTDQKTRKLENLTKNNQASLVIGGFKNDPMVQVDGRLVLLDGDGAEKAKIFLVGIYPDWQRHMGETTVFMRFDPIWLRCCDFSKDPADILVIEEF